MAFQGAYGCHSPRGRLHVWCWSDHEVRRLSRSVTVGLDENSRRRSYQRDTAMRSRSRREGLGDRHQHVVASWNLCSGRWLRLDWVVGYPGVVASSEPWPAGVDRRMGRCRTGCIEMSQRQISLGLKPTLDGSFISIQEPSMSKVSGL